MDLFVASAKRAGVFRGYKPVGEFVVHDWNGEKFLWRKFEMQKGWSARQELSEFVDRINDGGFRPAPPE